MRLVVSLAVLLSLSTLAPGCSCRGDDAATDAGVDAPPDGPPVEEVTCEELPPVASGTCSVTGSGATKLLKGEVLTPTKLFHGGQVAIDAQGSITCVGCDCDEAGQTVITCPDAAISPGLINTHDHITFTQNPPYDDNSGRYDDRQQWRRGLDGKARISSSGGASADQIRWGELRFLMSGATSIVGSGGQPGLLRNLDSASNQEGLNQKAVEFDTFPLDDSGGTRRAMDCNYGGEPTTAAAIAQFDSYEPHTSEGINQTARNEFLCQSSTEYDTMPPGTSNNLVTSKTAMIHAIGLQPQDYGTMAAAGTAMIWSPRSNITLYGDTARVSVAARMGVEIALGTDWMPTGSMNMSRELACADSFNREYLNGFFDDRQLWMMVTINAASVTATDDAIGLLAPGKVADISIFALGGKLPYRGVIEAEPKDVALVLRAGKPLYGDDATIAALSPSGCDTVDVCTVQKKVCLMGEVGKTYDALKTAAGANTYPAFSCGVPTNEPSCTPKRPTAAAGSTIYTGMKSPTDSDGDGIENDDDNCPMVFNPVRPVDMGVQGDADGDDQGDACDVCPTDADSTTCTPVDPNDRDHDGVSNATDNCPDMANADQADTDMDGKGNACDACPTEANPGAAGCPVIIRDIKNATIPVGTLVRVTNALVTGRGSNGFFVQMKPGDPGYVDADYSGMFVFTGAMTQTLANAAVGARVTIDGTVAVFQGQTELDQVTAVTVVTAGPEALPAPTAATYAEVKTGGSRAMALEGVIVSLPMSSVTALNAGQGEATLTAGADTLVLDDFLYVPAPPITLGQNLTSVRGILALRGMAMKIEPRDATDLTLGPPGLLSLGPPQTFARVGVTNNQPTFPQPLRVTLTGPAQGATNVMIVSGSADLTVPAMVTVPDGQTFVDVPVTAVAPNANVTVMAMLGIQTLSAQVRVLATNEAPATVTLSPAMSTLAPAGTVQLTATLDIPALVDSVVNLSVMPTTAGTVPATVTILAGQMSATFTYTDTAGSGSSTVTATFAVSTGTATVTVSTGAQHLVINEVDYDQIGSDMAEFIEIYNPSTAPISLANKQLLLINGSGGAIYATIDLGTGTLAAGGYLVIAGANVTVSAPATKLDPGWTQDEVQNGAPDGIALIDNLTHTLIDALSYEGAMTDVDLPGFPPTPVISLVEGTVLPTATADSNTADGSLCRSPNGQDTNNAAADWKFCGMKSPGLPNP